MKKVWLLVVILALAVGAYFVFAPADQSSDGSDQPVEVQAEFENKVVYTTSMDEDTSAYRADCELRGGEFNECGSVCGPDADMCTEQCAYTCENISPEDAVIGGDNQSTSTENGNATGTMMEDDATSTENSQ